MRKLIEFFRALSKSAMDRPSRLEPAHGAWTSSTGAHVRAPERHRDRVLSEKAQRWLDRLPEDMRPIELSRGFPRIVNRLAALWHDEGLTEHMLTELLVDTRGGRQGFPAAVAAELKTIYDLHSTRVDETETAADRWPTATQV